MVLRNCLVLLLASQVIAAPNGYGVKGGTGAVAKAEASASAGAYSGLPPIPIPFPSGAGIAGSYSKSSSSSFASSSASSSSSSYSFSGSGINGIGLDGGCSTGSCGCSSGTCQNNGGNDIKTNSEQNSYGTAAQSSNNDCSSGLCGNNNNNGKPSTDCVSGNCGQTNSPSDIYVNIPGRSTKNPEKPSKYNGNGQNLPGDGKTSTYEPECNSYDCISSSKNPATDDEKRPSSYDVPIFGTTIPSYFPDKKEPCSSPDCQSNDNLNNNPLKPGYNNNLPVSIPECAGGICTSQTGTPSKYNPFPKPFTSSYNVPVSSGCTDSNCGTLNQVNVNTNQPSYNAPGNCGLSGCGSAEQPDITNPKYPQSYESSGKSTTTSQNHYSSTGLPKCDGPNCGTSGYASTNLNEKQPSTFKYPGDCGTLGCGLTFESGTTNSETQASTKGSIDNSFVFVDQPNCNGLGCSTPSLGNEGAITKQPYYSNPGNCGSSGCGSAPNVDAAYLHNQPNYQNSGNSLDNANCQGAYCGKPSYTNIGPSSVPSANCGPSGCVPQTSVIPSNNKPGYGAIVFPSASNQASSLPTQGWSTGSTVSPSSGGYTNPYSGTSYKPSSPVTNTELDTKPNTELVPPNSNSGVPSNTPYNPNESTYNNKQNNPGYTGGYGSPGINQNGVTKPHQESIGSTSSVVSSHPSYFPSTPQYSQNTNIPSKPTSGYDVKPFDSPKPSNNKQVYTGGFGAPKGPIDQSIPAKPLVTSTVSPNTQSDIKPSNIPSVSAYKPTNPGSYTQNPLQSSPAPHVTVPQPSVSKDNKKGVPYTGGFGGPSGFLKPNDYSLPAKLPTPGTGPSIPQPNSYNSPTKPSTPITGPSITQPNGYSSPAIPSTPITNPGIGHLNGYSSPANPSTATTGFSITQPNGYNSPTKPSTTIAGPSNTAPCASNNCGSKPGYATSISSASNSGVANANEHAAASAVAYTGGFGGPSGFLKPYDDGKVPANGNINGNPLTNLSGPNGNLGYSNTYNKNTANVGENGSGNNGAVAQANAVAISSAGAYGLGAGPNGNGAKGCSLGCGAPSSNGADGFDAHNQGINAGAVASSKSVAGAGSYGSGGSFASSSASAHASAGAGIKGGYGR